MFRREIYKSIGEPLIARLLCLQNREAFSATCGCFDRDYWCWKFKDFAGARFQEGVLPLTLLFSSYPDSPYYKNPRILEWIRYGLQFWTTLQHKNGSFDEAYPFEQSFVATAFTTLAVTESLILIKDYFTSEVELIMQAAIKAGEWLLTHEETHGFISNHRAGASAALANLWILTSNHSFKRGSDLLLQSIRERQSKEGWFLEYSGPDPGYQTQCLQYLALLYQKTNDHDILEMVERSLAFLQFCIHPDRTTGGEYGSRKTEFYFPGGIEVFAKHIPLSENIAAFMVQPDKGFLCPNAAWVDHYNFIPLLASTLIAGKAASGSTQAIHPVSTPCEQLFEEGGIYVRGTARYYVLVGIKEGGTIRVYNQLSSALLFQNGGWICTQGNNETLTTQRRNPRISYEYSAKSVRITVPFACINETYLNLFSFNFIRILSRLPFFQGKASVLIKKLIVRRLISTLKNTNLYLTRQITFSDNDIVIQDHIEGKGKSDLNRLKSLRTLCKFAGIHMGSSRYFQPSDCSTADDTHNFAACFNETGYVEKTWIISAGDHEGD